MGASQRRKGATAERAACRELDERYGRLWRRSASQSQGRMRARQEPDVVLVHPSDAWEAAQGPEVKYGQAPPVWAGMRQALRDGGGSVRVPWVLARSQREPWTAWIPRARIAEVVRVLLGGAAEVRAWDGWEPETCHYRRAWVEMRKEWGPVLAAPPDDLECVGPVVGVTLSRLLTLVEVDWLGVRGDVLPALEVRDE